MISRHHLQVTSRDCMRVDSDFTAALKCCKIRLLLAATFRCHIRKLFVEMTNEANCRRGLIIKLLVGLFIFMIDCSLVSVALLDYMLAIVPFDSMDGSFLENFKIGLLFLISV